MAYSALVIPVMIASPGDVAREREVTRAVIHDWNDVNSQRSGIVLQAVGWDSHSSPELGERPQSLINKRILKDCDILIGVFWTRLGTPTGTSASGSVEEIEEHVAAGKPAMIYFSSQPVAPESVDLEQYQKLKEMRSHWMDQGLIETYDTEEEFRRKLSKQLQLCIHSNDYLKGIVASLPESSREPESSPEIRAEPDPTADLSEEEVALLRAASSGDHGTIMRVEYIGGQSIQAGKQSFGQATRREFSRWDEALRELLLKELVIERGYKGEVFELTHAGWSVADAL